MLSNVRSNTAKFGTYIGIISRRFRPHLGVTYPLSFKPIFVSTKDRTWNLGKNVRIKQNQTEKQLWSAE